MTQKCFENRTVDMKWKIFNQEKCFYVYKKCFENKTANMIQKNIWSRKVMICHKITKSQ